jgi:hypothetical protein
MKNKAIILLIIAVLLTAGTASSLRAASHVDNISLKKQGEFIELTIYTDGPFTFSHFIEEAKAGKPYRVVVDLKDCLHKLPQFNFLELPAEVITSIRTSQYKIKPDKMVRIVADVARPVTYMVKQAKGRVTLVFASPAEKEFSFWCAAPLSEAEKIELALADPAQETVSKPISMPANPDVQKEAEKKKEFKPPTATPEQKESGLQLSQKPQPQKAAEPAVEKKSENKPAAPESEDKTALSAEERYALKSKLAQIFDKDENSEKTARTAIKEDEKKAVPEKPVPEVLASKDENETVQKPAVKQKQKTPAQQNKTGEKVLTDSQPIVPVRTKETTQTKPNSVSPQVPSKPEEKDEEEKPQDWKSEKELRKNPDRPPKVKGSLAESFPKREVVRYRSYGRRDPFLPLISKSLSGFQSGELPDVEALRLVGILRGEYKNMALLEDIEGYGYILEDGSKVKNGYVIQIYNNKILFQVEEFGWSRSVALSMDLED